MMMMRTPKPSSTDSVTFVEKLPQFSPLLNHKNLIIEVLFLKDGVKDVEQENEVCSPISVMQHCGKLALD
jgi:hypothetical protein